MSLAFFPFGYSTSEITLDTLDLNLHAGSAVHYVINFICVDKTIFLNYTRSIVCTS